MTDRQGTMKLAAPEGLTAPVFAGRTVIRNAFNNETFIFSVPPDLCLGAFEVILNAGGTGGGNALVHVHPVADEIFAVTSGRLKIVLAGKEHFAEAGQTITVPRGTPHWFANAGGDSMRATVSFQPPQRHVRFFQNFATLTQKKPHWFSSKGDPNVLLIALVLDAYRNHLYLAGPPIWLQKAAFRVLARLARWRGYTLEVPPDGPLSMSQGA